MACYYNILIDPIINQGRGIFKITVSFEKDDKSQNAASVLEEDALILLRNIQLEMKRKGYNLMGRRGLTNHLSYRSSAQAKDESESHKTRKVIGDTFERIPMVNDLREPADEVTEAHNDIYDLYEAMVADVLSDVADNVVSLESTSVDLVGQCDRDKATWLLDNEQKPTIAMVGTTLGIEIGFWMFRNSHLVSEPNIKADFQNSIDAVSKNLGDIIPPKAGTQAAAPERNKTPKKFKIEL